MPYALYSCWLFGIFQKHPECWWLCCLHNITEVIRSEKHVVVHSGDILKFFSLLYFLHVIEKIKYFCIVILSTCTSEYHGKIWKNILHSSKVTIRDSLSNLSDIEKNKNQKMGVLMNGIMWGMWNISDWIFAGAPGHCLMKLDLDIFILSNPPKIS